MEASGGKLGLQVAWSMAVGGMVGGGIFSTLGVVIGIAGPNAWVSFLVGTPADPIGDPYLLFMEVLTILSVLGLAGWVQARLLLATRGQRGFALAAYRSIATFQRGRG